MRRMRQAAALRARSEIDEHATALDLHRPGRNAILLVAGLTGAGRAVKFPVMPRADEVVAIEEAFAEWPAGVIAHIRNGAKHPFLEGQGHHDFPRDDRLERALCELVCRAEIDPILFARHALLNLV